MIEYNFKEVLLKSQEAVYLMRDLFISKGFEHGKIYGEKNSRDYWPSINESDS